MKKSSQRTAVAALSITQRSQGHHSLVERRHVHGERCQVLLHVLLARVPDVRKVQWQRYLTFVYVFPHFFLATTNSEESAKVSYCVYRLGPPPHPPPPSDNIPRTVAPPLKPPPPPLTVDDANNPDEANGPPL